jgi:glycerate kinase
VAAPDKFRGSASAAQVAGAIGAAGRSRGWQVESCPLSDGGEGLLDTLAVLGGSLERAEVTGPLGGTVGARWLLAGDRAVIEMAEASGLGLAGGAEGNRPLEATTRGTGELMVLAARAVGPGGTVVVGLGGSATTDGGLGALEAVDAGGGLGDVHLVGACDVEVGFLEAATRFGPQKGARPDQVDALTERLRRLAVAYRDRAGLDVLGLPGAGAAGGLGGALAVLGGRLRSGYRLVAEWTGLADRLAVADLVVTGEGALDATSFDGKVVGGVLADAARLGLPALVVAGRATDGAAATAGEAGAAVASLVAGVGEARALADPRGSVEQVVGRWLDRHPPAMGRPGSPAR